MSHMNEPEVPKSDDLRAAIGRLRTRSGYLRMQAFAAIAALIAGAAVIAYVFLTMGRIGLQSGESTRIEPYDYKKMEARQEETSARLKDFANKLTDARQELINEKYGKDGGKVIVVAELLRSRVEELSELRAEIERGLEKDKQDLYLEVVKLRSERDQARDTGAERRSFIRLVSEAIMRTGVLVLSVYVIAIVSSIAKYWFRVADHLNSIADSLDIARAVGADMQGPITALTPHAIDYQAEDWGPLKSVKGLAETLTRRKAEPDTDGG